MDAQRPLYTRLAPEQDEVKKLLNLRSYTTFQSVERAVAPVLQDWQRQPKLATGVLTRLRKARRSLTAWQVLHVMRRGRIETNVIHYSSAIIACESQGAWQLALDLLHCMDQAAVRHDVVSISAVMAACEKAGRWECALELLAGMPEQQLSPNVVSYSSVIAACEKKGRWQHALHLLGLMKLKVVLPNDISCNSAISACEASGQWRVAMCILQLMGLLKVLPDIISYNSLLSTCESSGTWELALGLLSQMQIAKLNPNIRSCNSIMNTLREDGKWQQCWNLLAFMGCRAVAADMTTLSFAVASGELSGKWKLVASLVCSIQERNVKPILSSLRNKQGRNAAIGCAVGLEPAAPPFSCPALGSAYVPRINLAPLRSNVLCVAIAFLLGDGHVFFKPSNGVIATCARLGRKLNPVQASTKRQHFQSRQHTISVSVLGFA